jgi:hypothetical protein
MLSRIFTTFPSHQILAPPWRPLGGSLAALWFQTTNSSLILTDLNPQFFPPLFPYLFQAILKSYSIRALAHQPLSPGFVYVSCIPMPSLDGHEICS